MPQYFDEDPGVGSDVATFDVALPDVSFTLRSDRGVFSHGHLDTGTSLLLRAAPPPPPAGDLLDLGCGVGPLAVALGLRSPEARIWAVDVNARARALTADNATANGVTLAGVLHPDDVPDEVSFSLIWSNPPIRIGKAALHELLERWLGRLTPDGSAVLVVQKHLGADSLHRWLTAHIGPTERLTSKAGFRLLRVTPT